MKTYRHYFGHEQNLLVEKIRLELERAAPENAAELRARLEHEERALVAIRCVRIFATEYKADPMCDHPEDAGLETGTIGEPGVGLRLCCNPDHYGPAPRFAVWHRIKDWPGTITWKKGKP